jgi:ABC-type oligopeptide transport system ATPase subunit
MVDPSRTADPPALLDVRELTKDFTRRRGLFGRSTTIRAVDRVSFAVCEGETFGLVGESGSGKTTTCRCILRLVEPTSGAVWFRGDNLLDMPEDRLRRARRHVQLIFQDPYSSLNPRMRVADIVAEPLLVHGAGSRSVRRARVRELLALVGLDPAHASRYPREFSGGQRQRIAIARALALEPALVVADEPVAALDASLQAQIVNLLLDLQARLGLTYLLVSHDLRLVRHVCNRVAVMYLGRLVEMAPADALFSAPRHPYTQALLSAVPSAEPGVRAPRVVFDPRAFDPEAPLREAAPGHWVAK